MKVDSEKPSKGHCFFGSTREREEEYRRKRHDRPGHGRKGGVTAPEGGILRRGQDDLGSEGKLWQEGKLHRGPVKKGKTHIRGTTWTGPKSVEEKWQLKKGTCGLDRKTDHAKKKRNPSRKVAGPKKERAGKARTRGTTGGEGNGTIGGMKWAGGGKKGAKSQKGSPEKKGKVGRRSKQRERKISGHNRGGHQLIF